MKRAILGAVLAALVPATLAACSSDDDEEGDAASGPTETVTVTAEPDLQPLILTTETVRNVACFDDPTPVDIAWFAAQWQANVDLGGISFELTGAEGVRQIGSAETVPPVNFGGRIDFDGDATWAGHRRFLQKNVSSVRGYDVESVDFWSPTAGQTGLVVLHLRFDPSVLGSERGGRIEGVRAAFTTLDGEEGEVTVETPRVLRAGDC